MVDPAAVAAVGKHFKFGSIFLEVTLEVEASSLTAGDELIIEADHFIPTQELTVHPIWVVAGDVIQLVSAMVSLSSVRQKHLSLVM